jgi:hypothetical protein
VNEQGVVCRVEVSPRRDEITYLGGSEVYIRDGNRRPRLEGRNLVEWAAARSARPSEGTS